MRVIQYGNRDVVPVVHGEGIVGPIVVALLSALLYTAGQHDDGSTVRFPAHAPEIVASGMQRTLEHEERLRYASNNRLVQVIIDLC